MKLLEVISPFHTPSLVVKESEEEGIHKSYVPNPTSISHIGHQLTAGYTKYSSIQYRLLHTFKPPLRNHESHSRIVGHTTVPSMDQCPLVPNVRRMWGRSSCCSVTTFNFIFFLCLPIACGNGYSLTVAKGFSIVQGKHHLKKDLIQWYPYYSYMKHFAHIFILLKWIIDWAGVQPIWLFKYFGSLPANLKHEQYSNSVLFRLFSHLFSLYKIHQKYDSHIYMP